MAKVLLFLDKDLDPYAVYTAPIYLIEAILEIFQKEIDFNISGSDMKKVSPMTVLEWAKFLADVSQQQDKEQLAKRYSAIVDLLLKYGG